jgi:glycosyltransferase domain-containing protein
MATTTIMIPTRNRPRFLRRVLRYLKSVGCTLPVLVTDSSDDEFLGEIQRIMTEVEPHLSARLRHVPPALGPQGKVLASLEWVMTDYCVFLADDDFIVPSSIEKCASFLSSHPEYVMAHGLGVSFRLAPGYEINGPLGEIFPYPQSSQESPSTLERLYRHACGYRTTVYSVHRLAVMKEIWGATLNTDMEFGEIIPSFLAIARGKSKRLDVFYIARECHALAATTQMPDRISWLTTPQFAAGFLHLRKLLADALTSEIPSSEADRQAAVTRLLGTYITDYLAHFGGNKLIIPGYPGDDRTHEPQPRDPRLEMAALMHGSSPFLEDFAPIYSIIQGR